MHLWEQLCLEACHEQMSRRPARPNAAHAAGAGRHQALPFCCEHALTRAQQGHAANERTKTACVAAKRNEHKSAVAAAKSNSFAASKVARLCRVVYVAVLSAVALY